MASQPVGPLERLPRPIPSRKWRRITFLYTMGEHLLAAEELNNLIVQSAERELLWKALRERVCALGITLGPPPDRKVKERGWEYVVFPEKRVCDFHSDGLVQISTG